LDIYPARVSYRGFSEKSVDNGYKKLSMFMLENAEDLKKEVFEEDEANQENKKKG
jgi:hypothetical protein